MITSNFIPCLREEGVAQGHRGQLPQSKGNSIRLSLHSYATSVIQRQWVVMWWGQRWDSRGSWTCAPHPNSLGH